MEINPYQSPSEVEPPPVASRLGLGWRVLRFCLLALIGGGCYALAFFFANATVRLSRDLEPFWTSLSLCALAVAGSEFLDSSRREAPSTLDRIALAVLAMIGAALLGGIVIQAMGLHLRMYNGPPYDRYRLGILLGMFALAIGIVRLGLWHLSRPLERGGKAQS